MSVDQDPRLGLAARLAGRRPDTDLAVELDTVDPTSLTGEDLAAYVRARWQVHNRAEALLLAGLRELGMAVEGPDGRARRLPSSDEFSGDEVAAVLGCSRTTASRRLDLADDLFSRLPELGAALWSGSLDEPKVRAISEGVTDLTDDHARLAVAEVLPEAARLPVMALRERLAEVVIALDPEWAERRRRRAEARGRVALSSNPSGTATLSLVDAPAADGIASMARVEALAARVRGLGVLTPINRLRLQVGTRLLDGSTAGMTDHDIVQLLAAEYHATNQPGDEPGDNGPDGGPGDDGPDDDGPDDDGPDDDGPDGPDGGPGGGPDDDGPDGGPGEEPGDGPPAGQGSLDLPDLPVGTGDEEGDDAQGSGPPVEERRAGRLRHGTTEVRLRLSTALGLDEHPATVPDYGAVTAPIARTLLAARHHGEWRVVLTDPDGYLQHVLLARHRPARPPRPRERHRARGRAPGATRTGAIVELQVPTRLLAALTPADHPGWAPLLTELQARLADLRHNGGLGRPPDAGSGPEQWLRRRPSAEADRWIRARDRHCVLSWCRRSAHRAEIDHTRDHAHGGPTLTGNLGAWCCHDHRVKHHAGWHVRQPLPGWFVIRTRAGITHTTRPAKVLRPLPAPRPARRPRPLPDDGRPDRGAVTGDDDWRRRFAATFAPRATTPSPPPRPTAPDPGDVPPF